MNETTFIGYQEQVYHERRTPSPDASNVTRWIIQPSVLAFVMTGAVGAGIALASSAHSTAGFTVGMFLFLGGVGGDLMIVIRSVTFDKQPAVIINERTPVAMELPEREQTMTGNRPIMVPTSNRHVVEYRGHSYDFSPRQCRLMIDRVEEGNKSVARDAFEIESTAYSDVRYIMAALGYWQENGRGVEWTREGVTWLEDQMRQVGS